MAIQYTIRGVPKELDREIRKRARARKLSLNRVLLQDLASAYGQNTKKRDLSDLVGRWEPDPEFDAIIASMRQIDWEKWK